jgi:uncharacterized protein (TIGR03086 family)
MQQQSGNPAELFEASVKATRRIVAGVKSSQLGQSTPCDKWTVQQLLDHINQASGYLATSFGGQKADTAGKGALEAYDAATSAAVRAVKSPGAMQKMVKGPGGSDMPGAAFASMIFSDNLLHGWDLAKATGQSTSLDSKLVDACYGAMSKMPLDMARQRGAFGPEVKAAPNASTQDKLLGLSGRDPNWKARK